MSRTDVPPHAAIPSPAPTVYDVSGHPGWLGAGALAAGGAGLLLVAWRLVSLLTAAPSTRPAPDGGAESGVAGGVGAASFFLIAYGIMVLRRPVKARLGDHDIVIEGHLSRRTIPWT